MTYIMTLFQEITLVKFIFEDVFFSFKAKADLNEDGEIEPSFFLPVVIANEWDLIKSLCV